MVSRDDDREPEPDDWREDALTHSPGQPLPRSPESQDDPVYRPSRQPPRRRPPARRRGHYRPPSELDRD